MIGRPLEVLVRDRSLLAELARLFGQLSARKVAWLLVGSY